MSWNEVEIPEDEESIDEEGALEKHGSDGTVDGSEIPRPTTVWMYKTL